MHKKHNFRHRKKEFAMQQQSRRRRRRRFAAAAAAIATQQQQMRRGGAHTREDGSRKDDDVAQRSLEFLQSIPVVHSSIYIVIHLSLVTHLRRGKSLFKARFTRREILNATVTPTGKLKPEKK
jgi:type II secretory pathway pseudopilin PulG